MRRGFFLMRARCVGFLLYCNGMKMNFKIGLQYDWKNNIYVAVAVVLSYAMSDTLLNHDQMVNQGFHR